jgi:hypothetical protein
METWRGFVAEDEKLVAVPLSLVVPALGPWMAD